MRPQRVVVCLAIGALACSAREDLKLPDRGTTEVAGSEAVATVGDRPITAYSLRKLMARQGAEISHRFDAVEDKQALLQELIRLEVLAQAARDAGFERDPEVQDAITRLLADRYLRELRQLNTSAEAVTDADVTAFYEEHRGDYEKPARSRASLIFLMTPPGASEPESTRIRLLAEDLRKAATEASAVDHASFAALARKHSNDAASRRRGGDIGWLPAGVVDHRWPREVTSAVGALPKEGAVAPVVETLKGFYIVRLTGYEPAGVRPLDDVAREIRGTLQATKDRELSERRIDELAKGYDVEINRDVLSAVGVRMQADAGLERPPSFPLEIPVEGAQRP